VALTVLLRVVPAAALTVAEMVTCRSPWNPAGIVQTKVCPGKGCMGVQVTPASSPITISLMPVGKISAMVNALVVAPPLFVASRVQTIGWFTPTGVPDAGMTVLVTMSSVGTVTDSAFDASQPNGSHWMLSPVSCARLVTTPLASLATSASIV
jgi:hypothetical protein